MNKTKIALGIGIMLAVLAVLTVPAAADAEVYFEPDPSTVSLTQGENVTIQILADVGATESGIKGFQVGLDFDPSVVNITFSQPAIMPPWAYWWMQYYNGEYYYGEGPLGAWLWIIGANGDCYTTTSSPSLPAQVANLTIEGVSAGTSPLNFTVEIRHDPSVGMGFIFNCTNDEIMPVTWNNGTIECTGLPETFSTSLGPGWNLISLPLTNTTDMKVSNIIDTSLIGSYDALYKYDASTHNFVLMSSTDTMENGVGYFINMTSGNAWTYNGVAYTSMSVGLSQGLNMVGWMNCSKDIVTDTALSSIDGNYWYAARWDTTTQKFENYNPVADAVFDDFTMMNRGEGYFISMKTAGGTLSGSC